MIEHDDEYLKMRELGDARLSHQIKGASARGALTSSKVGARLFKNTIEKATEALIELIKLQPERSKIAQTMERLHFDNKKRLLKYVTIGVKQIIDDYPQTRVAVSLACSIGRDIETELIIEDFKKNHRAEFKYQVSRTDKWEFDTETVKRGYLRKQGKKLLPVESVWDHKTRAMVGMFIIEACIKVGLVEEVKIRNRNRRIHGIAPKQDVLEWIIKSNEALRERMPYWLPLKHVPNEYLNLYEGGYKSSIIRPRPVVKVKVAEQRVMLLKADMPVFFGCMTKLSQTAFMVNPVVLECFRAIWTAGGGVAGLPSIDLPQSTLVQPAEDAPKIEWLRYREAKAIEKAANAKTNVDRKKIADLLMVLNHVGADPWYLPHQADARGRVYPLSVQLSWQSSNLERGLSMFADSREITSVGLRWLCIHAANCFGLDKLTLEQRVAWAMANKTLFVEIAKNPLGNKSVWLAADRGNKPWTFLAAAHDLGSYFIAKDAGKPYHSHLPVYVDASASGFQHMALLTCDETAAKKVNVYPNDFKADIYTDTANALLDKLASSEDEYAKWWCAFFKEHPKAVRLLAKRPVMTTVYSLSPHSAREYVAGDLEDYLKSVGIDIKMWGTDNFKKTAYLSKALMTTIRETNPSAAHVMAFLRELAQVTANANIGFSWTTPSGFKAYQATNAIEATSIKFATGTRTKYYRLGNFTPKVSARQAKNSIAPNFIHSLDSALVHITVDKAWAKGVRGMACIHDSFGGLAEDMDLINDAIREAAAEMYSQPVLEKFVQEVLAQIGPSAIMDVEMPKRGSFDPRDVAFSKYFVS